MNSKVKALFTLFLQKGTYVTEVKRTPREERNHQRNGEITRKKNLTVGLLSQVLSPEAFGHITKHNIWRSRRIGPSKR